MIKTNLNPRDYEINDVCRIINPKQQLLYIKNGLMPIDLYTSIDSKTGNDIIVMIFPKKESFPLYQAWCAYTLV